MKLLIERVDESAIIPFKAHKGDAGMDLFSNENTNIKPFERKLIHTGIRIQMPNNTEAQIRPRSGLALHNGITVLVKKGMKTAQMVIKSTLDVTVEEVKGLNKTSRGEGGFGSTGI